MTDKAATAQGGANPFKRLAYVYIGTSDYDADHEFYEKRLGADVVWELGSSARVAAFDLCGEPYLLLATPVRQQAAIYEVDDLESGRGLEGSRVETGGRKVRFSTGPALTSRTGAGTNMPSCK